MDFSGQEAAAGAEGCIDAGTSLHHPSSTPAGILGYCVQGPGQGIGKLSRRWISGSLSDHIQCSRFNVLASVLSMILHGFILPIGEDVTDDVMTPSGLLQRYGPVQSLQ